MHAAGRDIAITSTTKVLFSERGETKLDLVRYYLAVADPLMRAVEKLGAMETGTRRGRVLYELRRPAR